jgi:catechol 2,3-dioxygenase
MPNKRIKAVGEIALRVSDLEKMQRFYAEIIGLELIKRLDTAAFFRIAPGYGGHTQILALFDRSSQPGYAGLNACRTTLDHFAFEIDLKDYDAEKERLISLNVPVREDVHRWVKWRSIFMTDPEGNLVELVCHDPRIGPKE